MNPDKKFVKFICFTGIDGSGKSTLSKKLVDALNEKGLNFTYVYARLNPFILKPFMIAGNRIFLKKKNITKDYAGYTTTKRKAIEKHSLLKSIYFNIMLIDYALQIFVKVKLPLLSGKRIVCDRYIFDTVITDMSVDLNYSEAKVLSTLSKMKIFFPTPDSTFLVDVQEDIAFSRKNDVPSIIYLKERRNTYLLVGKQWGMHILDGTCSFDDQIKYILSILYKGTGNE